MSLELITVLNKINDNLAGIREELNYMNGIAITKSGVKISRDAANDMALSRLKKMQQQVNSGAMMRSATDDD